MEVDVAAPLGEVFEFVADYRNALLYMDHFQSFRPLTEHSYGLGAKVRASGRLRGLPISTELELVGFEKNRRLASSSRAGIRSFSEWAFEPVEGKTRVTFRADFTLPRLPIAGKLVSRLLEEEIKAGTRRTLQKLKRVLEEQQEAKRRPATP